MTETAQQEQATGMLKWLWLSAVVFVLDQITKWLAVDAFVLYERMEILPFFNLTLAHNYGAAFSFLADHGGWQRWFFTAIAGGVSVALVIWLKRLPKNDWWIAVSLALILGGALGNVYDRVLLGYVVDFLDFHWAGYHFPAFNIADSGITVGAAMMIIDMIRNPGKH
ncbi:MAG: signal peptidase II [Pseudomonadales bacterium]|nr:signal peptidase II [Pseudomonadales bacterium]